MQVQRRPTQVNAYRKRFIRQRAQSLFRRYWPTSELPVNPRTIGEGLGILFEELEEIGAARGADRVWVEIAALVNPAQRKVTYASRGTSMQTRRFTLAHELGHVVLHPGMGLMRESPMTDPAIRSPLRSTREREADIFAAELLMPSDAVRKYFAQMFGTPIRQEQLDENTAYSLTEGKMPLSQVLDLGREGFARRLAISSSLVHRHSRSLAEIFGVSAAAMAIQLLDLQLVQ